MLQVILKMFEVSSFTIFALPTTTESLKPHFCGFVVARSFILQVISNNYNYLAPTMVIIRNWLLLDNWVSILQSKKVLLLCDSHCTISLENPLLPCTKKFFCFLCCFLRLKIINCIFQCVKTRLSNWQWCSLAYLTCYQDTFEEENENVVHNKEEKNLFFLEN